MLPQAQGRTLLRWILVLSTLAAAPASPQSADRIWGRVHTTEGEMHSGFIRWDRKEAGWGDILDGARTLPDENYFAWLEAHDRERATRTIELRGHRISWYEVDPDFPMQVRSGVRFGQLDSLVVLASDRVELILRSGRRYEMEARGSNLGSSLRRVIVDEPRGTEIELDWEELERVVFSAPPPDAVAGARRLHGTVEDRSGNRFTGFLAWDQDEVLESDVLDGEEMRRPNDREIRFERIRSLTRIPGGTRVELWAGETMDLRGGNDVADGNRGVQIADPELGVVVIPWARLERVRFHEPAGGRVEYGQFDGGRLLFGTVVTREQEELQGELRWDADEAGTWEILNGESDGVRYDIEFGFVRRITPLEEDGAIVTLADGRTLELSGSRDVDADNKGVMVAPDPQGAAETGGTAWRLIPWKDIREVRFRPGPPDAEPENER